MKVASSTLVPSSPVAPPPGNLQGRVVTAERKESLWAKICHLFQQAIHWIKEVFSSKKPEKQPPQALSPPPLTFDTSFLRKEDPAYNAKRLGEMTPMNAIQSVSTEQIHRAVPKANPYRLGYPDALEYQNDLGDQAVLAASGFTALSVFGISGIAVGNCVEAFADLPNHPSFEVNFGECSGYNVWATTKGKLLLGGFALLLAASLYAHNKGWLGALLHDRSLGWRQRQTATLFNEAASALELLAKQKPAEANTTADKILRNSELIEKTLHVELQLPSDKAKAIVDSLRAACKEVLNSQPEEEVKTQ